MRINKQARLLLLTLGTLLALAAPASATTDYVSLGDSATAGPLIPTQVRPFGCYKSSNNYPHLTARALGLALTDPSCSGAKTGDMTSPQSIDFDGPNPPQFDSLSRKTDAVTLQIGGNDIGFSSIAEGCISGWPYGSPCQDRYVVDGRDELSERIKATAYDWFRSAAVSLPACPCVGLCIGQPPIPCPIHHRQGWAWLA